MKLRIRALVFVAMTVGAVFGPAFGANALPNACGYVRVTVFTTPVNAPGLPHCSSCSSGVSQGPNDPWVGLVKVESYECVRFW